MKLFLLGSSVVGAALTVVASTELRDGVLVIRHSAGSIAGLSIIPLALTFVFALTTVRAKAPPRAGPMFIPPGGNLAAALRIIFGKRVYLRLVEQHVVDHRDEWTEAHVREQLWLARWIRVRCWIVLLWTVLGALPIEQIRSVLFGLTKASKSAKDD